MFCGSSLIFAFDRVYGMLVVSYMTKAPESRFVNSVLKLRRGCLRIDEDGLTAAGFGAGGF